MDNRLLQACQELTKQYQLTKAEEQILILLTQGYRPKQIADLRCRNIETIRTQVKSIREKIGSNRIDSVTQQVTERAYHIQALPLAS